MPFMSSPLRRRFAYAAGVAFALTLLVWAGLFVSRAGLLREIRPVRPGPCSMIPGFTGPEDIVVDPVRGQAFVISADRFGVFERGTPPEGDIKLLDLGRPGQPPRSLHPLPGIDFFPHGIDLWIGPDGRRRLFVIDHGRDGHRHAVRIFDVAEDGTLTLAETVRGSALIDPDDIVALDERRFYLTNLYGSRGRFGRFLENYLMWPRADVVFFDGERLRRVADGLTLANGIALSPDRRHLLVAEVTRNRIRVYRRESDALLAPAGAIDLDMGPDNLTIDEDGAVWVAGHPDLLDAARRMREEDHPSPSEVVRIEWHPGKPARIAPVYRDRGDELSMASVAVPWGDSLYIGSVFAPYLLHCRLDGRTAPSRIR